MTSPSGAGAWGRATPKGNGSKEKGNTDSGKGKPKSQEYYDAPLAPGLRANVLDKHAAAIKVAGGSRRLQEAFAQETTELRAAANSEKTAAERVAALKFGIT